MRRSVRARSVRFPLRNAGGSRTPAPPEPPTPEAVWGAYISGTANGYIDLPDGGQIVYGQISTAIAKGDVTGTACSLDPVTKEIGTRYFVDGTVNAIVRLPDGGVAIGGFFLKAGGQPRNGVAIFNADGSLRDWGSAPTFGTTSTIHCMIVSPSGTSLIIGGSFSTFSGLTRNRLVEVVIATGEVTDWNPSANLTVYTFALNGTDIVVGGAFSSIGGATRYRLAAVDSVTGLATVWDPDIDGSSVRKVVLRDGWAYVGGTFYAVGGTTAPALPNLAEISLATGLPSAWVPAPDGGVMDLEIVGSTIYVCGSFLLIGDYDSGEYVLRDRVAAFTIGDPVPLPWAPGVSGTANKIAVRDGRAIVVGAFTQAYAPGLDPETRINFASFDAATGALEPVDLELSSTASALLYDAVGLVIGGTFYGLRRVSIGNAVRVNADGTIHPWRPTVGGPVNAGFLYGTKVVLAGSFSTASGESRLDVVMYDVDTGEVDPWNPGSNAIVNAAVLVGDIAVFGGTFTLFGGSARGRLAAVDMATLTLLPFNPAASAPVSELLARETTVVVGGGFTTIGGATRPGLAEIDIATGLATEWTPGGSSSVNAITLVGTRLIVGGSFTTFGGVSRPRVAVVDMDTGALEDFYVNLGGTVYGLAVVNGHLVMGGSFTTVNGLSRIKLVAVDLVTGAVVEGWAPYAAPGSTVYALRGDGSRVVVYGANSASKYLTGNLDGSDAVSGGVIRIAGPAA